MPNPSYMEGSHVEALLDLHKQEDTNANIRQQTMLAAQQGEKLEVETKALTAGMIQTEATRRAAITHQATQDAYNLAQPGQRPEALSPMEEERNQIQDEIVQATQAVKSSRDEAKAYLRVGDTKSADAANKVANTAGAHLHELHNSALNLRKNHEKEFASTAGSVDFDNKGDPTNLQGVVDALKKLDPQRFKSMDFDKDVAQRVIWGKNTEQTLKTAQTRGEDAHQQLLTKQAKMNAAHNENVLEQKREVARALKIEQDRKDRQHADGLKREDTRIGQENTRIGLAREKQDMDKAAGKVLTLVDPSKDEQTAAEALVAKKTGLAAGSTDVADAARQYFHKEQELRFANRNNPDYSAARAGREALQWVDDNTDKVLEQDVSWGRNIPASATYTRGAKTAAIGKSTEAVASDLKGMGVDFTTKGGKFSLTDMTKKKNATPENKAVLAKAQAALDAGVSPEKVAAALKANLRR